jgi:hypothetical protein
MSQALADDDGRYRFVLSHRDPGVHNWLDTTGRHAGIVILRQYRATNRQLPTTRVVGVDEVEGPPITAAERAEQLAQRRDGVARLLTD